MCATSEFYADHGHLKFNLYIGYYGGNLKVAVGGGGTEVEYDLKDWHDEKVDEKRVEKQKAEMCSFLMTLPKDELVDIILKIVENGQED